MIENTSSNFISNCPSVQFYPIWKPQLEMFQGTYQSNLIKERGGVVVVASIHKTFVVLLLWMRAG